MSLKEKIMLVDLNVSQWSARKYDAGASKEITVLHNAKANTARVNKLLIDSDGLRKITTAAGKARAYHYQWTLPWYDKGPRVLPALHYFQYLSEMNKLIEDFKQSVAEFVPEYENLKTIAYDALGSLFKESDYPDAIQLIGKFAMKISFAPMYDSNDFRVKLADDEIAKVKENIEEELNERIKRATGDIKERGREMVKAIADKLNDPNAIFRDSLIENLREFVKTIPILNFNSDPKIDYLCGLLKDLAKYDPEVLRWKLSLRSDVGKKAAEIYNLMEE